MLSLLELDNLISLGVNGIDASSTTLDLRYSRCNDDDDDEDDDDDDDYDYDDDDDDDDYDVHYNHYCYRHYQPFSLPGFCQLQLPSNCRHTIEALQGTRDPSLMTVPPLSFRLLSLVISYTKVYNYSLLLFPPDTFFISCHAYSSLHFFLKLFE